MIIGVERTKHHRGSTPTFPDLITYLKRKVSTFATKPKSPKKLSHTSPIWDCPWNGNWFQKIRPISLWKGSFLDLLIRKIFQHICSGAADVHIFLLLRTLPWTLLEWIPTEDRPPLGKNQWIWLAGPAGIRKGTLQGGGSPVINCWKKNMNTSSIYHQQKSCCELLDL